jgi:hypothetical protein
VGVPNSRGNWISEIDLCYLNREGTSLFHSLFCAMSGLLSSISLYVFTLALTSSSLYGEKTLLEL